MGQIVEFTMEREGLVKEGDRVELKEDCASTMSGQMYYYTIKDAIAMSSNLKRPLKKLSGTVIKSSHRFPFIWFLWKSMRNKNKKNIHESR